MILLMHAFGGSQELYDTVKACLRAGQEVHDMAKVCFQGQ